MLSQHITHLLSTYTTALQHLAEIRQVITAGKSPAGGRLTPFPQPLRDDLLALLDKAAEGLEEAVRALVPDFESATGEAGGQGATRMWASILLRTVEELVKDIQPNIMGRNYGKRGDDEAELLGTKLRPVIAAIHDGMKLLE